MPTTVYKITAMIPRGKVAIYSQIAHLASLRSPRHVGRILHNNHSPSKYPCHRVVNASGRVAKNYAFGGRLAQRFKLESEGIIFTNNKIDLKKYKW